MKYIVEGHLEIPGNELVTLEGCPERVGKDFACRGNRSLKTLKGCPNEIGGHFICAGTPNLKSFDHGWPEKVKVGKDFICDGRLAEAEVRKFTEAEVRKYFDVVGKIVFV